MFLGSIERCFSALADFKPTRREAEHGGTLSPAGGRPPNAEWGLTSS